MTISISTIKEVKQLGNVYVIFCFLQISCIVLTAGISKSSFLNRKIFLLRVSVSLIKAFDIGLNLSKYCTEESQWKDLYDEKGTEWTKQGKSHKLCPDVPLIVPGAWTIPFVVACSGKFLFCK